MRQTNEIPVAGQIFDDRFRIEGVLGEGGMGVVLRATHVMMEAPVAIKMLHPALAGQEASVARFLREARNASAVRSEHVGRVLDVARSADGQPYIVMEFLPGVDLGEICQQGRRLSVADAATYMLQACVAVAEAHAAGIVHRDLKPSNLFLVTRPDGEPHVKVFDFGISKRADPSDTGTQTLTKTGMALGTPYYMAPEQIADAKSVDERADIWSLGAILYEMLAGRVPFDGDTAMAIMSAVGTTTPRLLSSIRPDVPEALAALVHECLAKDPAKRVQDVGVFATRLAPFAPEEQRPLAVRVERTRRPERDAPTVAVKVLYDAPKVSSVPASAKAAAPPMKGALVPMKGPAPELEAKRPPSGPDYARRAYAIAVYIAVLLTVTVLLGLLHLRGAPPVGPAALTSVTSAPPLLSAANNAAGPPVGVSSAPATATSTTATTSTAPSATLSGRLRPTAKARPLPSDFIDEP